MSISAIDRRFCEKCGEETLHNRAICLTCKSDNAASTFRDYQRRRIASMVISGIDPLIAAGYMHRHERIHAAEQRKQMKSIPLRRK